MAATLSFAETADPETEMHISVAATRRRCVLPVSIATTKKLNLIKKLNLGIGSSKILLIIIKYLIIIKKSKD